MHTSGTSKFSWVSVTTSFCWVSLFRFCSELCAWQECLPLSELFWLVSLLISSAFLLQFSPSPEVLAPPQHHLPLQDCIKGQTTSCKLHVKSPFRKHETWLLPRKTAAHEKDAHMYFKQDRWKKAKKNLHKVGVTRQHQLNSEVKM